LAETQLMLRKAVGPVFAAIVDPQITTALE